MKQDKQWFARNDEMLLGDLRDSENPKDPFKINYFKKPPPKEITGKAFTENLVKGTKKKGVRMERTNWRYTEIEHRYSSVKERLFDNIPKAYNCQKDWDPLYSSFSVNKVFVPPMDAKKYELQQRSKMQSV